MSYSVERASRKQNVPAAPLTNETPTPTLLPEPAASGNSGPNLITLQKLLNKLADSSIATGKAKIQFNDDLVKKALEEILEARKREAEANRKDGGFFEGLGKALEAFTVDLAKIKNLSDPFGALEKSLDKAGDATINSKQFWVDLEKGALETAKWGAVVGSTVLAVASFGAAAPIAALAIVGAVLSCAAAADSSFHILEKLGVDQKTAMWIDLGMCVGGALCSGGAGVAQMLSQGSAMTVGATVKCASAAVDGISAGASATAGAAHIQVASYERDAKNAEADAVEAEGTQKRIERRIQAVIDAIKETIESHDRGIARVGEAVNRENATNLALVRA